MNDEMSDLVNRLRAAYSRYDYVLPEIREAADCI
jgi:hypothetical protein